MARWPCRWRDCEPVAWDEGPYPVIVNTLPILK
jgi:hypothetical protein